MTEAGIYKCVSKKILYGVKINGRIFFEPHIVKGYQQWPNEMHVEMLFRHWLKSHNWKALARYSTKGTDIVAYDARGAEWRFEVKGYPTTKQSQQRRMWFLYSLGQILLQVSSTSNFQTALVFPRFGYYERLALKLKISIRENLCLWVFMIKPSGMVTVLPPNGSKFVRWSNKNAGGLYP